MTSLCNPMPLVKFQTHFSCSKIQPPALLYTNSYSDSKDTHTQDSTTNTKAHRALPYRNTYHFPKDTEKVLKVCNI